MKKIMENLKPNEVVAPTLFVGVGGTGCKIITVNKTNFLLHGALTNQTDHYFKNSAWKQ